MREISRVALQVQIGVLLQAQELLRVAPQAQVLLRVVLQVQVGGWGAPVSALRERRLLQRLFQ